MYNDFLYFGSLLLKACVTAISFTIYFPKDQWGSHLIVRMNT